MSVMNGFPGGGSGDIMKAIFKQLGETETFTNNMAQGAPISVSMSDGTTFVSSADSKYPGLYIKHKLTRTMILDTGYNYSYMCETPGGAIIGGKSGTTSMYYYDSATGGMHAIACGSYVNPCPLAMMMDTDGDCWVVIRNTSNTDSTTYSCEIGCVNLSNYTYTKAVDWGGGSGSSENHLKGEFVATTPVGVIAIGKYVEYRCQSYLIRKSDMNVVTSGYISSEYSIDNRGKIAQAGTKVYFTLRRTNYSVLDSYVADYAAHTLTTDANGLLQYLCETTDYVFATGISAIYRIAKTDGSMTAVSTHASALPYNYWGNNTLHKVQKVEGGWLIVPTQDKTKNIVLIDEATQTASDLLSGTFYADGYSSINTRIEKFAGGYLMKSAYGSSKPVYFYNESARTAADLTGSTNAFYWTPGDRQSYIFITDAYRVYKFDVANKTIIATAILGDSSNEIAALIGTEDGCAVAMTKYGLYVIDPDGNAWCLDYDNTSSTSVSGAYRNKDAIYIYGTYTPSTNSSTFRYSRVIDTKEWKWFEEGDYLYFLIDYGDRYMERVA